MPTLDEWRAALHTGVDATFDQLVASSPPVTSPFIMTLDLFIASMVNNGNVRAFPGAEGFGAFSTQGGRGGRVVKVTNANARGPGSWWAANVEAPRPINVVFDHGLLIETFKDGPSNIRSGNIIDGHITIAGQTAPGGGITFKKQPGGGDSALGVVDTEDVIIRFVRAHCGPVVGGLGGPDAVQVFRCRRMILDHISARYGVDSAIDVLLCSDTIVQYCILSEALDRSTHPKGPHSTGGLANGSQGAPPGQTLSTHHNVLALNGSRNYRAKGGILDEVNCIIYTRSGGNARTPYQSVWINAVANMLIRAPFSNNNYYIMKTGRGNALAGTESIAYFEGNSVPPPPPDGTVPLPYTGLNRPGEPISLVRFPAPSVRTTTAEQAYNELVVNGGVGASLIPDLVDLRVLNHIQDRTGKIIDNPTEVGGSPTPDPGVPDLDSNDDGMPDWFIAGVANLYGAPLSINGPTDQVMTLIANTPGGITWLEYYFALKAEGRMLPPN